MTKVSHKVLALISGLVIYGFGFYALFIAAKWYLQWRGFL